MTFIECRFPSSYKVAQIMGQAKRDFAHRLYSLRHSFEKRMLEAGLDYGLRCLLMGHKNSRPSYGDGGSMEYRRDELLKISHPISNSFTTALPKLI